MIRLQTLRSEFRPTLRLSIPLVLAELGWMSMALVDTMMVGRLPNSALAISAVSLGGILVHTLAFFGGGLLIGLDTLVSQAFGAGQREDCHRSLVHGIYLSLVLTPLLMVPVWHFDSLLRSLGIPPDIISLAVPYSKALAWGTLPLLLYFAVRRTMQGMNLVRPIAFALVTANLINAFGNWLLIYGKLGLVHGLGAHLPCGRARDLSALVRPQTPHGPAAHADPAGTLADSSSRGPRFAYRPANYP
jgi:MATE family multidrug resistance protein